MKKPLTFWTLWGCPVCKVAYWWHGPALPLCSNCGSFFYGHPDHIQKWERLSRAQPKDVNSVSDHYSANGYDIYAYPIPLQTLVDGS